MFYVRGFGRNAYNKCLMKTKDINDLDIIFSHLATDEEWAEAVCSWNRRIKEKYEKEIAEYLAKNKKE